MRQHKKTRKKLTVYQEFVDITNIIEKITIITALAALILAFIWSRDGFGVGGKTLGTLFGISLLLFYLNRNGYSREAGIGFYITLIFTLTFLAARDDGIYNVPFIFFPVLMIAAGAIFGQRYIPVLCGIPIISSVFLFSLDRLGIITPFNGENIWHTDFFIIALTILLATTAILYVVMGTIEKNIAQIVEAERIIKETYQLTLESWAKALEFYGREPAGHSERIVRLTKDFTEALQLENQLAEELYQGALLHDIGKIGIPDSILLKPAPLTESEAEISQRHTTLAEEMLRDISFPQSVINVPLYHHEQWDGQGYPEKLEKEKIPFTARIFAVIDNWVSLTSKQVYRQAWSRKQATSYLLEQANQKFDGRIVSQFLNFVAGHPEGKDEI